MIAESPIPDGLAADYPPVVEALDAWQAETVLADPESRAAFFCGLSFARYQQWLIRTNAFVVADPSIGKGYIKKGQSNYQLEGNTELPRSGQRTMYVSANSKYGPALIREGLEAAQNMDDLNAGVTMLGIVQLAVHRLHNGHTRTAAIGRQLLAPEGRGYRAADDDRDYYARLATNKQAYMQQSLHPIRADLIGTYARIVGNERAREMGYDGPPISGIQTDTIGNIERRLPAWWEDDDQRSGVVIQIGEGDFAMLTILDYLDSHTLGVEEFLDTNGEAPKLSLEKFTQFFNYAGSHAEQTLREVNNAHDQNKYRFIGSIVDCIAHGDESIFGSPSRVLDHYRLPEM